MDEEKKMRDIVVPGEEIDIEGKPGRGVFVENGKLYSAYLGIVDTRMGYVNVIPLSGCYMPKKGDRVIGKIVDLAPMNWVVDINAPYYAPLHVNDVPWRVEFGDTGRFLSIGDVILAKVSNVNEMGQVWITLKEQGLRKLEGGHIITISPSKVPRVIGKSGSMIQMLKDHTNCRIYVGQNGTIWISGAPDGIITVIKAIRMIEREAHTYGLTDRVKEFLERGDE
ncbi:MAG: RNA-binding protein [Euryarchaeota archaeon]|nr:RNA-binding protein [Euryarchaeota archaeon]